MFQKLESEALSVADLKRKVDIAEGKLDTTRHELERKNNKIQKQDDVLADKEDLILQLKRTLDGHEEAARARARARIGSADSPAVGQSNSSKIRTQSRHHRPSDSSEEYSEQIAKRSKHGDDDK